MNTPLHFGQVSDSLLQPCVDMNNFPSNLTRDVLNLDGAISVVLGPNLTVEDLNRLKLLFSKPNEMGLDQKRVEVTIAHESWTKDLLDFMESIPLEIPCVITRVAHHVSLSEAIIVWAKEQARSWKCSLTTHIDTFSLKFLLAINDLEVIDFRPSASPQLFDAAAAEAAGKKMLSFFTSAHYVQNKSLRKLVVPLDIVTALPDIMKAARHNQCLEHLELRSPKIGPNDGAFDMHGERARNLIIQTILHLQSVKHLSFPLEWATPLLLEDLALRTQLKTVTVVPFINYKDADGCVASAAAWMSIKGRMNVDWNDVHSRQTWHVPGPR